MIYEIVLCSGTIFGFLAYISRKLSSVGAVGTANESKRIVLYSIFRVAFRALYIAVAIKSGTGRLLESELKIISRSPWRRRVSAKCSSVIPFMSRTASNLSVENAPFSQNSGELFIMFATAVGDTTSPMFAACCSSKIRVAMLARIWRLK